MKSQKRVKGRKPTTSGLIPELREAVDRISRKYEVSKSFVVAVALAEAFNIKKQERY
jgi:predicted transcriptional regulator